MLKRLFTYALIALLLCSCSKESNKEEIVFSSWGSITETKILENVIKNFEIANPNIKVHFLHIPQNYFQKIHLLFVSNSEPDVVFINNLYLPIYADKLLPLDDIINKNDFYKQSLEALTKDNKLLAVPRDISIPVFYYNKSLIKNDISNNWSFTDFIKIIDEFTKLNKSDNTFSVGYEPDIYWADPYINTLGFDKGIVFYKKLTGTYAPNPCDVGSKTLAQMFLNENLAFFLSGRWMYPKINDEAKFPFGIVIFPGKTSLDASGWSITKNSKHIDASIEFIKFLSSPQCFKYFTETGLIVPARKDVSIMLDNKNEEAFLKAINKSSPRIVDKNYKKNIDKLNKKYFE